MTALLVQTGTVASTYGGSSCSPSVAGTVSGNQVVLKTVWSNPNSSAPPATPSGWSVFTDPVSGAVSNPTGVASLAGAGYFSGVCIYSKVSTGGTVTALVDGSSGAWAIDAFIEEWSGMSATPGDQVVSVGSAGSNTSASLTSGVTTQANEVVHGLIAFPQLNSSANVGGSTPPATGYTATYIQQNNQTHAVGGSGYKIVSSTGTQTASWTWTQTGEYKALIVTFKQSSTDLSLALTGVAATGAVGGITQSGGSPPPVNYGQINRPVIGLNGPIALSAFGRPPRATSNAFTANLTLALSGVAAAAALGSISAQVAMALTGISATGAVGTVGASSGGNLSLTLTGVAATTALGALAPSTVMTLTGNSAVGVLGTVTYSGSSANLTLALIGVAAIGRIGLLSSSGGSPIAVGSLKTIFLSDVTPVPATAVFIAGTAFAQTGEMYICPYPSGGVTSIRHRGPFADRKDGARIISTNGTEFNRVQGISFTALNEMLVTLNQFDVVLSGVPLSYAGQVCVTATS